MRVCDLLRQLDEQENLSPLIETGVVSTTILNYYRINTRLEEKEKKSKRVTRMGVITEVASEFNVEQTTIYRARALMNKKVPGKFAEKGKKPDEKP